MLKKLDKWLVVCSFILLVVGLIMIFSASNVTSFMKYSKSPYYYFIKQIIFLIGGLIISFFALRIDTKKYNYFSFILLLVIIGLLVVVLINGKVTNQARSWISVLGIITLQPSEFVKVASIVWLSCYFSIKKNCENLGKILFALAVCAGIALLIALQPDLGTTLIYVAIVFLIFMSSPIKKKIKRNSLIAMIIIIAVTLLLLLNNGVKLLFERQVQRFNFLNPCERIYSDGNQVCNSYIAINNGGMFGLGLGNSIQKYLYLPEPYTDFIYAIIVEELGLIGGIVALILLFIILWRIFLIAKRSKNNRNTLIGLGIFYYMLLHIMVNLGGLLGLIPLTGVPLPFFSYGGSYLISLIVSISIILRIDLENKSS